MYHDLQNSLYHYSYLNTSRNAEEHFCLGLFNVNSVFPVKWLNSVISNHNNYRWISTDIGNTCLICSWYWIGKKIMNGITHP